MVVVYLVITSGMLPVVDSIAVLAHTVVAVAPLPLHAVKYIHHILYTLSFRNTNLVYSFMKMPKSTCNIHDIYVNMHL